MPDAIKFGETVKFECPACHGQVYLEVGKSDDEESECTISGFCNGCERQYTMEVYPE